MKSSDKNKIREPFPPEKTPNPPQIIDPNLKNERGENSAPVEGKRPTNQPKKNTQPKDSGKRLGDETEITDETTI